MSRSYASIYTLEGNELTVGIQTCEVCDEAIDYARQFAAELGESVELHDADGVWLVSPDPTALAKWLRD